MSSKDLTEIPISVCEVSRCLSWASLMTFLDFREMISKSSFWMEIRFKLSGLRQLSGQIWWYLSLSLSHLHYRSPLMIRFLLLFRLSFWRTIKSPIFQSTLLLNGKNWRWEAIYFTSCCVSEYCSLKEINLSNNPLSSLPNEIGEWKMLKSFYLNSVSSPLLFSAVSMIFFNSLF